jgi:SEC-C motif-containing protein
MRSRYAAFALGHPDYLWRTWHPHTRPEEVDLDPSRMWTGLAVLGHGEDWVEFVASYDGPDGPGQQRERSRFRRRAGRWMYLDAVG